MSGTATFNLEGIHTPAFCLRSERFLLSSSTPTLKTPSEGRAPKVLVLKNNGTFTMKPTRPQQTKKWFLTGCHPRAQCKGNRQKHSSPSLPRKRYICIPSKLLSEGLASSTPEPLCKIFPFETLTGLGILSTMGVIKTKVSSLGNHKDWRQNPELGQG